LVLEIGWFLSKVEQDGTQGDGDGHMMVIKCSNFRKEGEKQNPMGSRQRYK
jgi:hypothetical protein